MTTYFAEDGSFGDARGLVVLDTSNLTEEDWLTIEEASDSERAQVAATLSIVRDTLGVTR